MMKLSLEGEVMTWYDYYREARDTAWKALIECGISSLPVDLKAIASFYGIEIVLFSQCALIELLNPKVRRGDGFIVVINGRKTIFLNDMVKSRRRRRFTVGHELGHGIIGHPLARINYRNYEGDSKSDPFEMQANVFSRSVLMPACVLNALGVSSVDEIMDLCDISQISAAIRLNRLKLLRERDVFLTSQLEKRVYEQFEPFIEQTLGR